LSASAGAGESAARSEQDVRDVLAANLTAPFDKTPLGDAQQSKDRFITEVYDEMRDFPPVVNGKRTVAVRPQP
jgi:hypothetical protein